ncbi:hypothetical protein OKW76_05075 [Sphingomonas sp. S1-29]|uniref:hypothetical protein n=1 Tax=Sphingomonas sp. S1-29 TaxID=2991074 RepID=UPI00223E9969|nr:hypothetical protein [Sphingomonas sp. S1-29]UZK70422.1 hypothetical protein OKW76_05075 [Sphingomonas sp. S1-29]
MIERFDPLCHPRVIQAASLADHRTEDRNAAGIGGHFLHEEVIYLDQVGRALTQISR